MNLIKHFVSNVAQWKGKLRVSGLKGCIITRNGAHSLQGGSAVQQHQCSKVRRRITKMVPALFSTGSQAGSMCIYLSGLQIPSEFCVVLLYMPQTLKVK